MRQQIKGEVADLIPFFSAIYLKMQERENFKSRFTFAKVVTKKSASVFFDSRCVNDVNDWGLHCVEV